jgi:hypothetical protein
MSRPEHEQSFRIAEEPALVKEIGNSKPKKRRRKWKAKALNTQRQMLRSALIGGALIVLVVALVIFGLTVRGLLPLDPTDQAPANLGEARNGKAPLATDVVLQKAVAVIDRPLPGVALLQGRLPPPPTLNWAPAPVAMLRPAQASNVLVGGTAGWKAQPDPPAGKAVAYPDSVLLYARNQIAPLLASCDGPFALTYEISRANMPDRPQLGIEGEPARGETPMPVTDLRTGKPAGRFAWNAPAWAGARLSPDAEYLIGPDNQQNCRITAKAGKLFVWKREQPRPVGTMTVPGPVLWLDFVSDKTVAILTLAETPVLQFWTVADRKLTASTPLPADEFTRPQIDPNSFFPPQPGDRTFAPDPWRGAVSPGRKFIAVAGAHRLFLVFVPGAKVTGSIPLPKDLVRDRTTQHFTARGLGFSPDGTQLWAMLRPVTNQPMNDQTWLFTWSMASGLLDRVMMLNDPAFLGPPMPGPEPDSLLIPYREFSQREARQMMGFLGKSLSPGSVVDAGTGLPLYAHQFLPLRVVGDRVLAFTGLNLAPEIALPAIYAKASPFDIARAREQLRAIHRVRIRPPAGATVTQKKPGLARPRVGLGDRSAVVRLKPLPPAQWNRPPAPPAPAKGLQAAVKVPNSRPLWGEATVSFLSSYAELMDGRLISELRPRAQRGDKAAAKKLEEIYKFPAGIHWHRYDLRTGRPLGPSIPLWPWATSAVGGAAFDFHKNQAVAGMKANGSVIALRDPADLTRVDCWDASGKRLAGFVPYDLTTPIDWLGWSKSGHLLTLGGGRLVAWEAGKARALYELDGSYVPPLAVLRGNGWLVLTAETHFDVVDSDTGKCLGRCHLPAGEFDSARPFDITLAPDGSLLACLAWRKKMTVHGIGILFCWDLKNGQALTPLFTDRVPGRTPVFLDNRRILFDGGQFWDVRARLEWGYFVPPPFKGLADLPYSTGALVGSPDGRVWAFGPDPGNDFSNQPRAAEDVALRPVFFPGADRLPTDPADVFSRQTPLRIEVDMADAAASRQRAEAIARHFQGQGFTIGPGGWTLRVWVEARDGPNFLHYKNGFGFVNVPEVVSKFRLVSPSGEVARQHADTAVFGTNSKYFKGVEVVGKKAGRINKEYTWEFPNKAPRQAMIEELLEQARQAGPGRFLLPTQFAMVQGRYQQLPIMTAAVFPPVVLSQGR